MAGNYGKFIDRSPVICAAGQISGDPNDTVSSTLKHYRVVDEIEALKHDANIWKEDQFIPPRKLPPIQNPSFKGTNTEISGILRPPLLTRYQQAIISLKETPYYSFWYAEIGKARDPTAGLPAGIDTLQTPYGKPSTRDVSVKDLINPSKGHYEVLRESQIGHDMYKKTHGDYDPSERIDRGYKKPPYNPTKCFGQRTKYDPRGISVKCACDWYKNEPLVHANKLQADFLQRTRPQLGKPLAPNNNVDRVPKGFKFGLVSEQNCYGVEDLLKDPHVEPCLLKRDFYHWLATLNKVRVLMREKQSNGFKLEDMYKKALYLDKEKSGLLPLEELYQLFACVHMRMPKELQFICHHLGYIVDGKINYRKFIDLIDNNKEASDVKPIDDLPLESKYYISTSQAANCDHLFIDNNNLPMAGVPSIRHDLPRPVAPNGRCRADIENFGDETSAKAVVNPSIYANYGLTYRDFFQPRSSETIRTLFEKLGYNFPGDNFQKLWKMGLDLDQTGQVSVDTFKRLLQSQCPTLKLRVDEQQMQIEKGLFV